MRKWMAAACAAAFLGDVALAQDTQNWAIVLHGGAGVIERGAMDAETEAEYRQALSAAIALGGEMLAEGADAVDVVEAVVQVLENDPKFNAGVGSVFTSDGRNELDASIMRGSDLQAGAAAGVRTVRHPISLARAIMENSPHVMLQSDGAEAFARNQGLEEVDPSYFFTERRWSSMERSMRRQGLDIPPRPEGAPEPEPVREGLLDLMEREHAFGTVGVVARDSDGVIVAGTSTGGTTAKQWGRVGDSPIIGAGTYATPGCGVSATGAGEYFIRLNVSARICTYIDAGMETDEALDTVIRAELTALGGSGGVVILSGETPYWRFNTPGMYRASWQAGGDPVVAIFEDEG